MSAPSQITVDCSFNILDHCYTKFNDECGDGRECDMSAMVYIIARSYCYNIVHLFAIICLLRAHP